MFNWIRFLQQYGIYYRDRGENCARNHVVVRCPFCGDADPGEHMGINLKREVWGCWRQASHRGYKPQRLIVALIGCTEAEADELVGDREAVVLRQDAEFASDVMSMLKPTKHTAGSSMPLAFPKDIVELDRSPYGYLFYEYLAKRGYNRKQARALAHTYGLRCAMRGLFRYRLVVPVVMRQGMVNWTARGINPTMRPRYRTLSADPAVAGAEGLPTAALSIERTLLGHASLVSAPGRFLAVCEGPMDALRIDYLCRPYGVRATCLFGKGLSRHQIELLEEAAPLYARRIVLLDNDASLDAFNMNSRLEFLRFEFMLVPKGFKDPAEMDLRSLLKLFELLDE